MRILIKNRDKDQIASKGNRKDDVKIKEVGNSADITAFVENRVKVKVEKIWKGNPLIIKIYLLGMNEV